MSTVVISSDEESVPRSPKRKRAKLSNVSLESRKSSERLLNGEADKENNISTQSIRTSNEAERQNTSAHKKNQPPTASKYKEDSAMQEEIEFFEQLPTLQELLNVCLEKITDNDQRTVFITKVTYLVKVFKKAKKEYVESDQFNNAVKDFLQRAKNGDLVIALQSFLDLIYLLKSEAQSAEVDTTKSGNIKILEKFLDKLTKKITALEEQEVDFEKDDNSAYIQMQRYRERAVKVYAKLCKCKNENPQSSSIICRRLDFSDSNYIDINKAINKKFKNGKVFPTYLDIEKCIRKCVTNKQIDITEAALTAEARHCFEKLGNLLQYRRRYDLHDVHSQYLQSHLDPARLDQQLDAKLKANRNQANQAINSICEKYVRLQDEGKDQPTVSSDSEDSNYKDSANEESD